MELPSQLWLSLPTGSFWFHIAVGKTDSHFGRLVSITQNWTLLSNKTAFTNLKFYINIPGVTDKNVCKRFLKNIVSLFWVVLQTSTGMFGLGNSQTKCTKSYSTSPVAEMTRLNPLRLAKLVWINNRTVTLMLADGSETRFNV